MPLIRVLARCIFPGGNARQTLAPAGWAGGLLLAALLFGGCRKEEITVYHAPKPAPMPPPTEEQPAAAMAPPAAAPVMPDLHWKTPAGWAEQSAAPGGLPIFAILGGKAELSVKTFRGEGASQLNLVNIVRRPLNLPDLSEADMTRLVETVNVGAEKGSLIDLSGATASATNASDKRILLATLAHGGITWFFKLSGEPSTVTAEKPHLVEFLQSVSFTEGTQAPAIAANSPHANIAQAPDTAPPSPDKPTWEVPANWKEQPASTMVLAKFLVTAADGQTEVSISSFAGDVGGPLANINRWRGQVKLEKISTLEDEKSVTNIEVAGAKALLVDITGESARTGKPAQLIGVILPRGDQTWFYKMLGDAPVTAREKENFLKFIQSARYPNG